MIPDLKSSRNRFLPWALGGETDWRNTANNWVDGKI